MFCRIKKALAARAAARATQEQRAQRLALVLARQAQVAGTVRQVGLLEHLARCWLPERLRLVVQQELQARVLALPIPAHGSAKSSASSARTERRSTSKRRRAR